MGKTMSIKGTTALAGISSFRVNCIYKSCLSSPIFIQEQISFQCQHLVMSSTGNTNPGNFANRPREEVQEIASKGGQSRGAGDSGGSDETAGTTSATGNTNPGNFANIPREEVQEIASKGGQSRGAANSGGSDDTAGTTSATGNTNPGNFANRPKEEVQEIASKGGKASSGSFEPGSDKAREAGSKGGSAR